MAQLCKVSTEDVETLSAMVKVVQEYCDLHERRVLTWNGGGVEKDAVALDEEKGEIIIVELRSVISSTTRLITSRCVQYPVRGTTRQER